MVSSNGTQAGTGIIWTVGTSGPLPFLTKRLSCSTLSRPRQIVESLHLFLAGSRVIGHTPVATRISFRLSPMEKCLWQPGEHWLSLASTRLRLRPIRSRLSHQRRPPGLVSHANEAPHEVTGTLLEINGSALSIKTRAGKTVMIDATKAAQAQRSAILVPSAGPLRANETGTHTSEEAP